MEVVQSALSTIKTLPNILDYAFVYGISAYLMYYYMQNYECNMQNYECNM